MFSSKRYINVFVQTHTCVHMYMYDFTYVCLCVYVQLYAHMP